MSAGGSINASQRIARIRSDAIVAVLAAEPDRAFTVEDIWMKLRRTHTRSEIRRTVFSLKNHGRLETVRFTRMAGKTTYRLAREVKSA